MNTDDRFSDEQLNAFIDGELDAEERSRMFSEAEQDPELEKRLCQQKTLGELVRHAYQEPPRPNRQQNRGQRRGPLGRALVASALILVGLAGGLLVHSHLDRGAALTAPAKPGNYILHVSNGDQATMQATLRQANELISSGTLENPHRVEVVANERGLDLLRSDITPFAAEIAQLADSDVVFYACSRAIQRLEEQGVTVKLVPQAHGEFTALDRVILRMQDDWEYIKL
jgi:intracellular sulfur oxidation DsrE/DsrF family protein